MNTTNTYAETFRATARTATETWSEATRRETAAAKDKAEARQPWAAREHAREAQKAAWLTELAATAAGDERSANLARAAKEYAETATEAAERAEAQERWNEGTMLLQALHDAAAKATKNQ